MQIQVSGTYRTGYLEFTYRIAIVKRVTILSDLTKALSGPFVLGAFLKLGGAFLGGPGIAGYSRTAEVPLRRLRSALVRRNSRRFPDAPWPATKDELIDYAMRSGSPLEVIENLQEIEDEGEVYESIEDIWPDYPTKEDFFFHEDEY